MKIYFVSRVPREHGGQLCEPIGVALTEADAVAMCCCPNDGVVELEAGARYQPGAMLPADVRAWRPLCPGKQPAYTFGPGPLTFSAPALPSNYHTGIEPTRAKCPGDPADYTYNATVDCWTAKGSREL